MGYRLHVCSTYKVQYGDGVFNHLTEEMNAFMADLCDNVSFNEDELVYSSELEIGKEDFKNMIAKLKEYSDDEIPAALSDAGYTQKNLIAIFDTMYQTAEPDLDYIRLEWF